MTTYNLINNCLQAVKSIRYNNRRVVNPPDALVVLLELGYPLIQNPAPEYDIQTQYLSVSYQQQSNAIVQLWTINEIPQQEIAEETPQTPTPTQEEDSSAQSN